MTLQAVLPVVALLGATPHGGAPRVLVPPAAYAPGAAQSTPAIPLAPAPDPAAAAPADPQATPAQTPPPPGQPPIQLDPLDDPAAPAAEGQAKEVATSPAEHDPLEGFNRGMFNFYQGTDKTLFRPLAMGYAHVVPKVARTGLRNFFKNIDEPIVFINDMLQLKPGRAARTVARFTLNTVFGLGGLIDLGKHNGLPHRSNGFGNTLARYGVGPGPYVFLPFIGPSTLRDLLGGQVDGIVLPLIVTELDRWEFVVPRGVITGLDARAEADPELKALFGSAIDPYATLRSVYLQNRAAEVLAIRGQGPVTTAPANPLDDPLIDPANAKAGTPGAQPQPVGMTDPLVDPASRAKPATAAKPAKRVRAPKL